MTVLCTSLGNEATGRVKGSIDTSAGDNRPPPSPTPHRQSALTTTRVYTPDSSKGIGREGSSLARPDTDDGWYKKSIELEAALDYADFTKVARTILRLGFAQIFGVGKRPRYIVINVPGIARLTGLPRQHLNRGLRELVLSRVFKPVPGKKDTYRFIKDYELWKKTPRVKGWPVDSDEPRLAPKEVEDCLRAVAYSMGFKLTKNADTSGVSSDSKRTKSESQMTQNGVSNDSLPESQMTQKRVSSDSKSESQVTQNGGPPMYPLLGRDLEKREIQEPSSDTNGVAETNRELVAPSPPGSLARLTSWVRKKLLELEYDEDSLREADKLCARWVDSGGRTEWCAQSFQAAVDQPDILNKTTYARKILRRMVSERDQGLAVLAPAICDFRADDPPEAGRATVPARPTYGQRVESERQRFRDGFAAMKIRMEAEHGDGA